MVDCPGSKFGCPDELRTNDETTPTLFMLVTEKVTRALRIAVDVRGSIEA